MSCPCITCFEALVNRWCKNQGRVEPVIVITATCKPLCQYENGCYGDLGNPRMASPLSARSLTIPDDGCSTSSTSGATATVGSEQLSIFQRRLLQNSWQHLTKTGTGGITNVMFNKFMSRMPESRQLFTKASVVGGFSGESTNSLQDHVRLLADLLEKAVTNLDNLGETGQLCVNIGGAHSLLNGDTFNAEMWDKFGQTMLESVTQLDAVRKHKELVRAWMILISFLIDKIRQGYCTAVRRLKFQQQRPATFREDAANQQRPLADLAPLSKSQNSLVDDGASSITTPTEPPGTPIVDLHIRPLQTPDLTG